MKSLRNYIQESIDEDLYVDGNKLVFGPADDTVDAVTKTKFGKNRSLEPYVMSGAKVAGVSVYSVHKANSTEILKALKNKNEVIVDPKDYEIFVDRTATYLARVLRQKGADVIITPTSSAPLLSDLTDAINKRVPHITFLKDSFQKISPDKIDNIKIRYDLPGMTPKIERGLKGVLSKARKDGYFEIKKVDKRFAKYLTGYFELTDTKLINKLQNKRVVILDDVISSGATFSEIINTVQSAGPETLFGLTIFKT